MSSRLVPILLVSIILVHILILTKLIYFPYPELFIYPYLTNHGLKPYSQIIDQHFPGLLFLPINFDNLGMNNEAVARWWSISIVVNTHILLFFIACKILKSKSKALLTNFLYLIWQPFFEGWVLWIDSFLPLILLPAFYTLYNRRFFLTGFLLGIGIVFKQVLIPLSILVLIYIFWEKKNFKDVLIYSSGLLPPIILMIGYFLLLGNLGDFWYWTIVFNLTIFAQYGRKLPFFTGLVRVGFVTIFSSLIVFLKDRRLVQVLAIFIVGSLTAIFARFDFVHLQPALPFVLIATVAGSSYLQSQLKFKLIKAGYILVTAWWLLIFYRGYLSDQVLFFDQNTKEIADKIKQHTNPLDKIFIFGSVPHLYQMSNTLPAGNIFVFPFPWFLRVAENRILEGIKRNQPLIIVSDRTVVIEGQNITDFARKIDQYIEQNYQKIDQVGSTAILIHKI